MTRKTTALYQSVFEKVHVKYTNRLSKHPFSRVFQSCGLVPRFPGSRFQSPAYNYSTIYRAEVQLLHPS